MVCVFCRGKKPQKCVTFFLWPRFLCVPDQLEDLGFSCLCNNEVVAMLKFNKCATVLCLVAQSHPTLCDLMDCSLPGFSVRGDSPGKNTGVGGHALLQGTFPTQGSKLGLLHCRQILYCLGHQEAHKYRNKCANHSEYFWQIHPYYLLIPQGLLPQLLPKAVVIPTPEVNFEHFGKYMSVKEVTVIEVLVIHVNWCHCIEHFNLYSFKKHVCQRN